MIRSVLSILAGFVVMTTCVMGFTLAAMAVLYPGQPLDARIDPSAGWIAVNLAYSLAAAVAGGWVTARIATRSPMGHAVALALIVLAMAVVGRFTGGTATGAQPGWYATAVSAVGIAGVLLGGWLAARHREPAREPAGPSPAS